MIRASIIGATGYAGEELIRLLMKHPEVELKSLVSKSFSDQPFEQVYPNFSSCQIKKICEPLNIDKLCSENDIIFTALPHGEASKISGHLFEKGVRVIDLSGDFRYASFDVYRQWYGEIHTCPQLLEYSVYGLPELHRDEILKAKLIGNPGCYTTCSILGLAPAISHGLIDTQNIIIDAKSGATGAGRNNSTPLIFSEVDENLKAYNVTTHRHTSEIEQELSFLAGNEIILSFTPHLIPVKRGILSTMYANIKGTITLDAILNVYHEFFHASPFVHVMPAGVLPEIKYVNGTNNCYIGLALDKRLNRLIVVSVIDNLIKGAAGQAIQNMNLMLGLDETAGLDCIGWYL